MFYVAVAPHDSSEGKVPAAKIMTDGASYMNAAALSSIFHLMNLAIGPTAIQGRVAGAKGMVSLVLCAPTERW